MKPALRELMAVSFLVFLILYVPYSTYTKFYARVSEIENDRDRRMMLTVKIATAMYKAGVSDELTEDLRESMARNEIDYFVVYKNGTLLHAEPESNILAVGNTFDERKNVLGHLLEDENRSEISQVIGAETVLTIGRGQALRGSLSKVIFETGVWRRILFNTVAVFGLLLLAVYIHTREIVSLRREIRQTGRLQIR